MTSETNTITLTRAEAKRLAQVGLSAASADDITPVISGALITVDGGSLTVLATDRYRVHTAQIQLDEESTAHEFNMPRAALVWLAKNAGAWGRHMVIHERTVITTTSEGALTVTVNESLIEDSGSVSWSGCVTPGNYPPVLALFEKARSAEVGPPACVQLKHFAKANALGGDHEMAPLVKFTATGNPNKPGPVYLAWSRNVDGKRETYAEALIQPSLNLY